MVSVDSLKNKAFTSADKRTMEFIQENIQLAITSQLSYLEKSRLALTDYLTGVYNRLYLTEQFNFVLEKATRYNEHFCVAVFDIDDLKQINDTFGHLIGDQVIKEIANVLLRSIRRSDILARYGGDEFISINFMTNTADLVKKLNIITEKIKNNPWIAHDQKIAMSFSFGVASFPEDGKTYNELLQVADRRMYEDKTQFKAKNKVK